VVHDGSDTSESLDSIIDKSVGYGFFEGLNSAVLRKQVQKQVGINTESNQDLFMPRGSYSAKDRVKMTDLAKTLFDMQVRDDGHEQIRLDLYSRLREGNPFLWEESYQNFVQVLEVCVRAGTVFLGSKEGRVRTAIEGLVPEKIKEEKKNT
jgi:hypothetical protein